jgi:hypothetical protein
MGLENQLNIFTSGKVSLFKVVGFFHNGGFQREVQVLSKAQRTHLAELTAIEELFFYKRQRYLE